MDGATCTPPPNRNIPEDILEEILCKLPVKSLIRFRCVSRSWNSKISQSWFIRKHLTGARATLSKKRLVINHNYSCNHLQTAYCLSSLSNHSIVDKTHFVRPFTCSDYVILRAFCDELWWVEDDKSLYLWNPSIRACKKIADHCHYSIYGMGYDSVYDDYKVLKIPYFVKNDLVPTALYSLRNHAWKEVQLFPPKFKYISTTNYANFMNGAMHWMGYSDYEGPQYSGIVAFDLSSEKHGAVPHPEYRQPLDVDTMFKLLS